jgi:hypothetical protein
VNFTRVLKEVLWCLVTEGSMIPAKPAVPEAAMVR